MTKDIEYKFAKKLAEYYNEKLSKNEELIGGHNILR